MRSEVKRMKKFFASKWIAGFAIIMLSGCGVIREDLAAVQLKEPTQHETEGTLDQQFKQLEKDFGARLGVYALDTGTGLTIRYRADER
ncbi:class A beta-lactamase, partial [Bacillus sp. SIMBA_069]